MTAVERTELERQHVGYCAIVEVQSAPWAAVAASTWRVDCRYCDLATSDLDRDTAADIACRHFCPEGRAALGVDRQRYCDCGAPCPPGRWWCSESCHQGNEPGAYTLDEGVGPFDVEVAYGEIGEDL